VVGAEYTCTEVARNMKAKNKMDEHIFRMELSISCRGVDADAKSVKEHNGQSKNTGLFE
jgi:hypothetical protein